MSDRWAVVMVVATAVGAYVAADVPLAAPALLLVAALIGRRPALMCIACGALASSLSHDSWTALDQPLPPTVEGVATLTTDPDVQRGGSVRAELKMDDRLLQMTANPAVTTVFGSLSAGDRVYVTGLTGPVKGLAAPHLRRRHVAGRVQVQEARFVDHGSLLSRSANAFRGVLTDGAASMSIHERSLMTGLMIGDDREQSAEVIDDFRESGLAHLLAVSGSNVAFVLLVVSPLLTRFSLTGRLLGGLFVLLLFGTITRWEPSVVRAEAMAAVVLLGVFLGRPLPAWRCLCLAVSAVLLIDPFLIGSVGFLMSAGACVGMIVFGERISEVIPGPQWLNRALGYTLAAQGGVAPVQLAVFGSMPVVALVTNVLAEPAAGAVMVWGLTAGLLAGVLGEPFAELLHLPTRLFVNWIALVADKGASAGLGDWDARWLAILGIGFYLARRRRAGQPVSADYGPLRE